MISGWDAVTTVCSDPAESVRWECIEFITARGLTVAIRVIWLIRVSSSLPLSTLIIRMSAHLNSVIGTSLISEHSGHTRPVQLFWRFPFQMLLRLHKVETLNPHAKSSILTMTAVLKEKHFVPCSGATLSAVIWSPHSSWPSFFF